MPWVFAYGSNMHLADLRRWLAANGYADGRVLGARAATLPNYELVWNYFSESRQGGTANVRARAGTRVHGVALELDVRALAGVDVKEGHPLAYTRVEREIHVLAGSRLAAHVYEVAPTRCFDEHVPPTRHYLGLLLEGAREHRLAPEYVAALAAVATAD